MQCCQSKNADAYSCQRICLTLVVSFVNIRMADAGHARQRNNWIRQCIDGRPRRNTGWGSNVLLIWVGSRVRCTLLVRDFQAIHLQRIQTIHSLRMFSALSYHSLMDVLYSIFCRLYTRTNRLKVSLPVVMVNVCMATSGIECNPVDSISSVNIQIGEIFNNHLIILSGGSTYLARYNMLTRRIHYTWGKITTSQTGRTFCALWDMGG